MPERAPDLSLTHAPVCVRVCARAGARKRAAELVVATAALGVASVIALGLGSPRLARAQAPTLAISAAAASSPSASASTASASASPAAPEPVPPPPSQGDWLQVGAALISESVTSAGGICPGRAREACILGSGGGVALRAGRRFPSGIWAGGVYAFSRQDAANLIKLPILQQLRFEARWYLRQGYRFAPYLMVGGGIGAYGSEWRAETFGPLGTLGIGGEMELTQQVYAGGTLAYRALVLNDWVDSAGQSRGGVAHIIGLELTLETRGPFERW